MNEIEKNDEALIEEFDAGLAVLFNRATKALLRQIRGEITESERDSLLQNLDVEAKQIYRTLLAQKNKERERILNWIQDPKNISVGQAGDFRHDDIVVLKRHLLQALNQK